MQCRPSLMTADCGEFAVFMTYGRKARTSSMEEADLPGSGRLFPRFCVYLSSADARLALGSLVRDHLDAWMFVSHEWSSYHCIVRYLAQACLT